MQKKRVDNLEIFAKYFLSFEVCLDIYDKNCSDDDEWQNISSESKLRERELFYIMCERNGLKVTY